MLNVLIAELPVEDKQNLFLKVVRKKDKKMRVDTSKWSQTDMFQMLSSKSVFIIAEQFKTQSELVKPDEFVKLLTTAYLDSEDIRKNEDFLNFYFPKLLFGTN